MTVPETALTWAEIDLDALASNLTAFRQHLKQQIMIMAVVKANAYGHGAIPIARAALASGADRLAVNRAIEGVALREAGIRAPILILGYLPPGQAKMVVQNQLTPTVTSLPTAQALSAALPPGKTLPAHIKIDTGMGRLGLLPDEAVTFVRQVTHLKNIKIEGLFTHFAVADAEDKTYTWQQFRLFQTCVEAISQVVRPPILHVANSAATLTLPAMHLDMVRVGIAMYGLRPDANIPPPYPLHPVLSLKSRLGRVRTLPAGASISYGRTYVTPRAMPVGLVPVGYGDGYHRLISNRGAVLVNGVRAPIVGRVCMDQFVVDLTNVPNPHENDEIVLIGQQGNETISADEVARWAETINYEVTTSLLPRVQRFYFRDSHIVQHKSLTKLAKA